MKFYVENMTKCTQRLGTLSEVHGKPLVFIKTPAVMLHTQGGQIPHITHELFKSVSSKPQILQIPLAGVHMFKETMPYFEGQITKFIGSDDSLSCLTVQDPCNVTQQGHHATLKVPVWTKHGKVYYDSKSYMAVAEDFKPDMYIFLYDGDTNVCSSQKRISKSITNTVAFYRECLEIHRRSDILKHAFAIMPVVGGYDNKSRAKCVELLLENVQDIDGFLIDGIHNNGPETEFLNFEQIESAIRFTVDKLPPEKLRLVQGCWNPVTVLNLVECGIDLFDSSYCHVLTERSAAMVFAIELDEPSQTFEINLRDYKYVDDFQPVLTGCQCLCCRNYSRAYIHHLLSVNELLGPILIMIHNVFHYLRFFEKIQCCIKDNTLQALQLKITEQYKNHNTSPV